MAANLQVLDDHPKLFKFVRMRAAITLLFVFIFSGLFSQVNLVYGPYLQQGGPNSMLVAWRTSVATDAKLTCGTNSANLTTTLTAAGPATTHSILISGLSPNTKYYYRVSNAANNFSSGVFFFYTAPLQHSNKKIRFIATGDCGTAMATQTNVKGALMNYINGAYINGWLLLGDNAYDNGTDAEYTYKFWAPYQTNFITQYTSMYPCIGNHDYANDASQAESKVCTYYDIFHIPTTGQLGGFPSNSESYYSYNYGNIHFVVLDSYGTESSLKLYDTAGSVQYQWLKQDLNQNTSMWTVVYFHHPPYTMGSHNSDTETDLVAIREKLTPLLESKRVDVVLNGHSHNYERSWLMKGHKGMEGTFSKTLHATDTSSARYDGGANSCPYIKDSQSNKGVVYAVCGSSGWFTFTQSQYPHNAMYYSNTLQGMAAYMEVDSNRFDARFIGEDGLVHDRFTIFKNVNRTSSLNTSSAQVVTLKASWNGNYVWANNGALTKQNAFSVPNNTVILVRDSLNCIADTFKITVVPAGIKLNSKKELKVYPNPVNGNVLTIELEDPAKVKAASITDVKGKTYDISFSPGGNNDLHLRIPELDDGTYILKLETKDGILKQKLILGHK